MDFLKAAVAVFTIATALCVTRPAHAGADVARTCDQQGADAEGLALARNRGLNQQEAIAAVMAQNPSTDIKPLMEAAELLFHRFRNMPVEQVAFEFAAACIDDSQ